MVVECLLVFIPEYRDNTVREVNTILLQGKSAGGLFPRLYNSILQPTQDIITSLLAYQMQQQPSKTKAF